MRHSRHLQQSEGGDETGGSNATFNVFSEGEGDLRLRRGRRARNSLTQGALMVVAAETLAQGGRSRMSISARGGAAGGGGGEAASLRAQRHVTLLEQNKGMLKEYLVKQGTQSAVGDLDHIAAHIKRELAKRDTEVDVAAAHAAKKERAEEVLAQLPLLQLQLSSLQRACLQ